MYDDGLEITNNWLADNFVGAFLMYSWRINFERNVCLNNRGVSGYGLGIKNIDDIRVRDNRILDNTVGIWMNSSPSALEVTNWFQRNVLAYNDAGLMLDASDQGNLFTENTFMNNNQQVARDGDGALERVDFSFQNRGNYWSDYKGYPGSNPAIGALPYRVQNLFDSLADQYPNLQLFRFSPAQEAIGLAAQAFPLIQPEVVLTDDASADGASGHPGCRRCRRKNLAGCWACHWRSWPAWLSWLARAEVKTRRHGKSKTAAPPCRRMRRSRWSPWMV